MLAPYLPPMAPPFQNSSQSLAELTRYLFTRREAILNQWRSTCEQDPALSKISTLSREEFNNLLPLILGILEDRLLNKPQQADPVLTAQAHGLHRWHKALNLLDTLNELNHLTQTLCDELRQFGRLFPQIDSASLLEGQQLISQLMQETISGSIQKYDELQRLQASNRANTLQGALDQMVELSRQRGDMLRTSAHDLRGGFGIINAAADLLNTQDLSDQDRTQFMEMLSRTLTNVQGLLTNLMDLSRLESGQEKVQLESLDAAQLLRGIVASAQPMATERGILLWADGPADLIVETDRVKLQRIVQNLLLNALKYPPSTAKQAAFISVSWSVEGDYRWSFSIQDTGPGLPPTTVGMLGQQLRPTVEPTSVMAPDVAEPVAVYPDGLPQIPDSTDRVSSVPGGEGVGLQIVKRLCELLEANLDVETQAGRGTLFRIRLPRHANL